MYYRLYLILFRSYPKSILTASLLLLLIHTSCTKLNNSYADIESMPIDSLIEVKTEPNILFGIPVDSFNIFKDRIRPNRFLSEIVADYGVSMKEVDQLVRNSKDVFNVRSLRSGNDITFFTAKDSVQKLMYLIYEHEPALYYIFSFNDSLNITPYHQPTADEIIFSKGIIETSLWETMVKDSINPELAVLLSDIYAWTVDFFGLQKGDSFKAIYEEHFIDGKSIGIDRILAAEFSFSGKIIYAIPLIQDGNESFYDTTGVSLRKAFLKAPLRFSRISSRYSSGRMHPILRIVRPHYGVDYVAVAGTPVYSIGDGKVLSVGTEVESGRIVRIRHNSVYSTAYMHLSRFGNGIKTGAFVKQGQVIGYVGSSGLATGPHLDFRVYQNGYAVDPLKVEAPPVEPVYDTNLVRFEKVKKVYLDLLSTIN